MKRVNLIKINKYLLLLIVVVVGILYYISYRNTQIENKIQAYEKKLFYDKLKAINLQIDSVNKASNNRIEKLDSILRFTKVIEAKRKADFNYYQKKLHELTKVNTYVERQHYADSLERSMR